MTQARGSISIIKRTWHFGRAKRFRNAIQFALTTRVALGSAVDWIVILRARGLRKKKARLGQNEESRSRGVTSERVGKFPIPLRGCSRWLHFPKGTNERVSSPRRAFKTPADCRSSAAIDLLSTPRHRPSCESAHQRFWQFIFVARFDNPDNDQYVQLWFIHHTNQIVYSAIN